MISHGFRPGLQDTRLLVLVFRFRYHTVLINSSSSPIIDNSSCDHLVTPDASSSVTLPNWLPPHPHFLLQGRFSKVAKKKGSKYLSPTETLSFKAKGHYALRRNGNAVCVQALYLAPSDPSWKECSEERAFARSTP